MQIQTFSILCGTTSCNARCPFCIAAISADNGMTTKPQKTNNRNFHKACALAKQAGTTTVMLTGKGEPTLFPEQITEYMEWLEDYNFPFIELQTNGIDIASGKITDDTLNIWYDWGMTTIAISIVHYDKEINRKNYAPHKEDYFEISDLVEKLHKIGFSVRLNCILNKQGINSWNELENLVDYCKAHKVEQLTLIPVNKPTLKPRNDKKRLDVYRWIEENYCERSDLFKEYLDELGTVVMTLNHGAVVYDFKGQNVCMSNCLTVDDKKDEIRNLIFFPDGHLRYSWEYEGAILL